MELQLTTEQQAILHAIMAEENAKLLGVHFVDQEQDQKQIRRSIHLQGGRDMLIYLLEFDEKVREQREQEQQALLSQQRGEDPPHHPQY